MLLAGLGGAITFFPGEAPEILPADSLGNFLKDFFGFLHKSTATFFIGGATGILLGLMRKPTLTAATGGVAASAWLGLAALILLVQTGMTAFFAHPIAGLIREDIDLFKLLETELQTGGRAGEMTLVPVGALFFGVGLAAASSLVFLIGAVCPLFYVLFNIEGAPRLCLRTACLQIAWLMVLFYLQDLLQASGRLLTVPGNLDITVHAWFMSQKAAIASVSRQLSWLFPGFLISTTIVVFKARQSVGDAGGGLSGADAMVAVPTAHAPVSAPLPDRWLDQDFYSIKYKFLSNPLYKVFSLGSLEEPQLLIARMAVWRLLTRIISLRPVHPQAGKPAVALTIIGHRILLFPKIFVVAESTGQKLGTLVLGPVGWLISDPSGTQIGSVQVEGHRTMAYGVFFRDRRICRMRFERIMRPTAILDFEGMNAKVPEKKLCIALAFVECFKSVAFNYQHYSSDG
jgi:hypothetical protein